MPPARFKPPTRMKPLSESAGQTSLPQSSAKLTPIFLSPSRPLTTTKGLSPSYLPTPLFLAASYTPFFEALSLKLNQSFPVSDNPWLPFRLAPTDLQFAIHGIPLDALPDDDDLLFPHIQSSLYNSKNFLIRSARYLNLDPSSRRKGKRACSVVVHVSPDHADRMVNLPSVLLYGSICVVERAYPSSPSTQCRNCWRFGHVKPRCKNNVICPFCTGNYPKSEHCCSNPSCPKEGNL